MFTRWILPPLLILALLAGMWTGFANNGDKLQPSYQSAQLDLQTQSGQAEQLNTPLSGVAESYTSMDSSAGKSKQQLADIKSVLVALGANAKQESALDAAQKSAVDEIVTSSSKQTKETGDVLDTVLSKILGKPIGQTFGNRATIKVFSLKEAGYRGYMAKVKLSDPSAVKLVLAGDKIGAKGEVTSAAAARTGGVLAINAGGFATQNGLLYPMGITVVDGEIKTFYQTDLSFIGINKNGHLVGGDVTTREQIKEMGVQQGATFIPTLLKGGKKQTIPTKWKNKKEPRTLIGHFSNGDMLFIVIDGRSSSSSGITLEEAQTKLLEWNVVDAYNLDGGGSSTFVYNGKVLNTPSDGKQRKVVSNFVVLP
ncbi:phosphodiester glycosidase family protein [Gorillibacterium massiliense]|uniref:phosphodiester glycosidase family protein n=1 Tax=Gorillibacterium massiliense TaxID=1280390 RepID=UPI0004BB7245|nr:phosphodiester glycosidase family protein [Gorillibacterium massiliense]